MRQQHRSLHASVTLGEFPCLTDASKLDFPQVRLASHETLSLACRFRMNVRCLKCGVVNIVTDEVCKVCGAELQPAIPQAEYASEVTSDPTPRVYNDVIPPFLGPSDGIGPTFHLFRKNVWLITKIVFVIVAPFEVFRALSVGQAELDWQLTLGLFLMERMCDALIAPALFYALLKVIQTGTAPGVNEAYLWGLGKIPKLALAALMVWVLTCLGLLLLVIPGIILSLAFAVVYPVAVFEKGSAVSALRRSFQLTKGHRWNILAASMVIGILVSAIDWAASGVVNLFVLNGITFWPLTVAGAIVSDIFSEAITVLFLVIYLGILRTLESGQSVIE